jgi:hypothetical protein
MIPVSRLVILNAICEDISLILFNTIANNTETSEDLNNSSS